jgi:hypothetical protein
MGLSVCVSKLFFSIPVFCMCHPSTTGKKKEKCIYTVVGCAFVTGCLSQWRSCNHRVNVVRSLYWFWCNEAVGSSPSFNRQDSFFFFFVCLVGWFSIFFSKLLYCYIMYIVVESEPLNLSLIEIWDYVSFTTHPPTYFMAFNSSQEIETLPPTPLRSKPRF